MRDNMLIYRSFFEAIKEMPDQSQVKIWNAVFELGLNNKEVELEGLEKTIFTLIKPQIEANIKRFINGKAPKTKQTESKPEAKPKQEKSKTETNNNINNNYNNNINERKELFKKQVFEFYDTVQNLTNKSEYECNHILLEFFEYWSETGPKDKKMRYEKERTYDIKRRLNTWLKNYIKFNGHLDRRQSEIEDNLLNFVNREINKK